MASHGTWRQRSVIVDPLTGDQIVKRMPIPDTEFKRSISEASPLEDAFIATQFVSHWRKHNQFVSLLEGLRYTILLTVYPSNVWSFCSVIFDGEFYRLL